MNEIFSLRINEITKRWDVYFWAPAETPGLPKQMYMLPSMGSTPQEAYDAALTAPAPSKYSPSYPRGTDNRPAARAEEISQTLTSLL